jgi:hypothetical protein
MQSGEDPAHVASRVPGVAGFFLPHIDTTFLGRVMPGLSELVRILRARGVAVVNGGVTNISKRALQHFLKNIGLPTLAASRSGDPSELIIKKTNANCGGLADERFAAANPHIIPRKLVVRDEYVVQRRGDIEASDWTRSSHVFERYVANESGRFYRAYVLGRRIVISESASSGVVKKMGYGLPRTSRFFVRTGSTIRSHVACAASPACQVARFAAAAQLNFGALDLVEDRNGVVFICDVNITPFWGEDEPRIENYLRAALEDQHVEFRREARA